ncbi:MAG: hypothetical protein U0V49_02955 [Saprospiraceae bacterium]
MKYGCLKVLMFCSFNIFLKSPVAAQEMSVEAYAADCIRLLHEGDLIIQLKSEEKKLQALQGELFKGGDAYRQKILNQINKTERARDSFNYYLIHYMNRLYDFSKTYFYYDNDRSTLMNNGFTGSFFVDSTLNKTILRHNSGQYYLLLPGTTPTQGLEALIVSEPVGSPLPAPFPSYYRRNNFKTWRNAIFYPSQVAQRDARYFAETLQKKLAAYYKKCKKNYEL